MWFLFGAKKTYIIRFHSVFWIMVIVVQLCDYARKILDWVSLWYMNNVSIIFFLKNAIALMHPLEWLKSKRLIMLLSAGL